MVWLTTNTTIVLAEMISRIMLFKAMHYALKHKEERRRVKRDWISEGKDMSNMIFLRMASQMHKMESALILIVGQHKAFLSH